MSESFRTLMTALDGELLEEAMEPLKKRAPGPWLRAVGAAAACLVLALPMLWLDGSHMSLSEVADMGYALAVPETARHVRCALTEEGAQASFSIRNTDYVVRAVPLSQPRQLSQSQGSDAETLAWRSGSLDMELLSRDGDTWVSWYTQDTQTQWYLSARAEAPEVLTAASQILAATGLQVTAAPAGAEKVTYNAFLLDRLTVAETGFRVDGVRYTYRMAATRELREDFADLSGMEGPFAQVKADSVFWCRAKLCYDPGGQGKIIWFDLVPGILYCLTMDTGASHQALLDMANSLFEPAQGQ